MQGARLVRERLPNLELLLWLVGTGAASQRYLDVLRQGLEGESWIRVAAAPYPALSAHLAEATVLCVPHPPSAYMDVALPVKLLDGMAAGRPLVVTPRTETVRLVERARCGLVARGDTPEDLAAPLLRALEDEALARRLGEAGRRAAVEHHDWRVVGGRIADEVLRREA